MKLHPVIGIAAAVLFAGAAGAQSPASPATPATPATPGVSPATPATPATPSANSAAAGGFASVDKDSDGSISKKEAASNKDLTKKWDNLDSNKDGKLDSGEFAQFEVTGSVSGSTSGASGSGSASGSMSTPDSSTDSSSGTSTKKEKPKF